MTTTTRYRVASWVTVAGAPGVVAALGIVAAAAVWLRYRRASWAAACIVAPGLAGIVEATLKVVVARRRPVTAFLTGEAGNGFPSGHAAGFTALACIVAFVAVAIRPRSRVVVFVGALTASVVIALSRVLVGVHYPSDVIAGVLLGYAVADAIAWLARRTESRADAVAAAIIRRVRPRH